MRSLKPYLHSPVDDLESFYYYTAQWAAAFNDGASEGKYNGTEIGEFRKMIIGENRHMAECMVRNGLCPDTADAQYGPFFVHSLAFLSPWLEKLATMHRDRDRMMFYAKGLESEGMKKYLGLNFLIYGYRGVGEYFELVHEYCASLQVPV